MKNKSYIGKQVEHVTMVASTQALGMHVKRADGTVGYEVVPRTEHIVTHTIIADLGGKVRLDNGWELSKRHLDGVRRWHSVGDTHYDDGAYRFAAEAKA